MRYRLDSYILMNSFMNKYLYFIEMCVKTKGVCSATHNLIIFYKVIEI